MGSQGGSLYIYEDKATVWFWMNHGEKLSCILVNAVGCSNFCSHGNPFFGGLIYF